LLFSTDAEETNALMFAASNGHLTVCRMLVEAGIPLNLRNQYGNTALMFAVNAQSFEIAEYLAYMGADLHLADEKGRSPLHISAALNDFLISDMLVHYGADINKLTHDNSTPLHYAAYYGAEEIVKLLIQKNADISLQNSAGFNAIMLAAQNRKTKCVNYLGKNFGLLMVRNNQGLNTYDILAERNLPELFSILPWTLLPDRGKSLGDSIFTAALQRNQYSIAKGLKRKGYQATKKLLFSSSYLAINQKFSTDDFFTGLETGGNEHIYKSAIFAGFMLRPYRKHLMIEEKDMKIQVWERRMYIYTGLRKSIILHTINNRQIALSGGISFALSSTRYRGFRRSNYKGTFIPEIGIQYKTRRYLSGLYYEFADWNTDRSTPHQFRFSIQLPLNDFYKPFKPYSYEW
jgi:hypothetical protein